MNFGFMQKLREQQEQGRDLGSAASLLQESAAARLGNGLEVDENAGFTPSAVAVDQNPALQAETNQAAENAQANLTPGAVVANEVIRRLEENSEGEESGLSRDNQDLRESLGQSLDWVRERFGDDAAAAASGMVMSATANGVTEDTLGEGLLNVAKFIDRNYGAAAGDAAIANFNADVNVALNEYFDNGKYETFHVASESPESVVAGAVAAGNAETEAITARFFARAVEENGGQEQVDPNQQLLEDIQKELENVAALQDLTTQLEENFNPAKVDAQAAVAAYTEQYAPAQPLFADIAV